jgi:hypothetical protein
MINPCPKSILYPTFPTQLVRKLLRVKNSDFSVSRIALLALKARKDYENNQKIPQDVLLSHDGNLVMPKLCSSLS